MNLCESSDSKYSGAPDKNSAAVWEVDDACAEVNIVPAHVSVRRNLLAGQLILKGSFKPNAKLEPP